MANPWKADLLRDAYDEQLMVEVLSRKPGSQPFVRRCLDVIESRGVKEFRDLPDDALEELLDAIPTGEGTVSPIRMGPPQ